MATFEVKYTSRNHATNVDAVVVGLRVIKDGEYFQFFLGAVPGPELRSLERPSDRWWQALVAATLPRIEAEVCGDFDPLPDPAEGCLIFVPLEEVSSLESSVDSLPDLVDDLLCGHKVHEFTCP